LSFAAGEIRDVRYEKTTSRSSEISEPPVTNLEIKAVIEGGMLERLLLDSDKWPLPFNDIFTLLQRSVAGYRLADSEVEPDHKVTP
jgi:hypothetical protein